MEHTFLAGLVAFLYFWLLHAFDPRKQALHDKAARAVVANA